MRRIASFSCAIAGVAGLLLSTAAGASAAAARPARSHAVLDAAHVPPGTWKLSYVTRSAAVRLESIAAAGTRDAWAVGTYANASHQQRPLVLHWNGVRWSSYPVPGMGPRFVPGLVETTSPTDVWIFFSHPAQGGGSVAGEFHFDGSAWQVVPAPPFSDGSSDPIAVVTGGADVWESSSGDCSSSTAPYCSNVWQWNGVRWSSTQVPTALRGLAAAGRHLWLVGQHAIDPKTGFGRPQLFRWAGSSWQPVPGPYSRVIFDPAIAASPRGDLWLESVLQGRSRTIVYHWNGSAWNDLRPPVRLSGQPVEYPGELLTYDGHAGIWLGGTLHWTGRRWISTVRVAMPSSQPGLVGLVQDFVAPVPGASSTWGLGNGWFCRGSTARCNRDFIAVIGGLPS
jgi:hypothetical protein